MFVWLAVVQPEPKLTLYLAIASRELFAKHESIAHSIMPASPSCRWVVGTSPCQSSQQGLLRRPFVRTAFPLFRKCPQGFAVDVNVPHEQTRARNQRPVTLVGA